MKIAPSLLSADFANLASELKDIEKAGADLVHLDVMDGHFVPNLTFGCPIIKALRKHTTLPFDVHLMTEHPEVYFDDLAKAGAAMVSFHAEAAVHHDRLVHAIQEKGMKAGIALNPGTPLSMIEELLPILDFVLIMSVNPGFGGQKFISYSWRRPCIGMRSISKSMAVSHRIISSHSEKPVSPFLSQAHPSSESRIAKQRSRL